MKNKLHPGFAVVCSVLALAGCARKPDDVAPAAPAGSTTGVSLSTAQRARLHLATIERSAFHPEIETTGTVGFDADRATAVLAPISGPVSKLLVPLGASVKAGDPLALVSSPDFATAISGYRKALGTAKNLRRVADLDKQLFAADALARRDLEQAETDAVNAEADRDAALQQLRSLGMPDETIKEIEENRPLQTTAGVIRSPLAGTVVERLISPGQLLQAGTTPCFTVADLSQVWVAADVFEAQLSNVAVGDEAEVHSSASAEPIPGKVDNIGAILDSNTRSISVRVVANNPGGVLKKGMYVRVVIRSHREATGLLVPLSTVLRDSENLPFVFVAQRDGSFARRSVTVGSRIGDRLDLTAGLKPGEQVVVDGGLFVQFQQNQ